ncbi:MULTISPECIES: DUF6766 family protein [unclassified Rathayibacter]|uniref:DUF6766 family protein n=1 Tax=unclassified Rathayibacter TaxID=2609250 RepID=UPI000A895146
MASAGGAPSGTPVLEPEDHGGEERGEDGSEFLQTGSSVVLTVFLYQRGSSESKSEVSR